MCDTPCWVLLEILSSQVSLDPNPENTSYTLPWGWSPTKRDGEQSRTQMARGGREKPLESEPGIWLTVLALRLIRSLGNVTELLLASALSFVERRDWTGISESSFSSETVRFSFSHRFSSDAVDAKYLATWFDLWVFTGSPTPEWDHATTCY